MPTIERPALHHAQNFLHSSALVRRLIARSSLTPDDAVLEIGPGRGIITHALAVRCRRVHAVERDARLAAALRLRFAANDHVTIHTGDFLRCSLPDGPYKVFANIPFFATAAIVSKLTSGISPPDDTYLVMQREAALRYLGVPTETLVALLLKPWFEPAIMHRFDRHDFAPAPSVETVLLRLRKRVPPLLAATDAQAYRDLVISCFTAWRPTLYDALRPLCGARRCDDLWRHLRLACAVTPSDLDFERWLALFHRFADTGDAALWLRMSGAEQRLRHQQAGVRKVHRTCVAARHGARAR